MAQFDFKSLSPDMIIDGLESAGFTVDSGLLALNSYENRVYQFHDDNLNKYVTKFYRPQRWQLAQIQEEHNFSFELDEHELPIVAPLKINGTSLFEHQGYHFAVFPCRGGRIFEVDNLDQLEWMGRFVGRIHAVAAQESFVHRPCFNVDEMLYQASNTIERSETLSVELTFLNDELSFLAKRSFSMRDKLEELKTENDVAEKERNETLNKLETEKTQLSELEEKCEELKLKIKVGPDDIFG